MRPAATPVNRRLAVRRRLLSLPPPSYRTFVVSGVGAAAVESAADGEEEGPRAASTTKRAIPMPPATMRTNIAARNHREARRLRGRVLKGVSFREEEGASSDIGRQRGPEFTGAEEVYGGRRDRRARRGVHFVSRASPRSDPSLMLPR